MWAAVGATLSAGLFAGAAIYVNAVEHPARLSCGVDVALREFAPSYRRATVGGHFIMRPAYGRIGSVGVGGLEVIGYDASTGQFETHFVDNQGNAERQTLSCVDGVCTWQSSRARCVHP